MYANALHSICDSTVLAVMRCWRVLSFLMAPVLLSTTAYGQQGASHADSEHLGMKWSNALFVLFDQLEYASAGRERPMNVDAVAWYGGAVNRAWVRAQSEFGTRSSEGEAELQVLAGRLVAPFWDAVAGIRVDQHWGDTHRTRTRLALGLIGLAPYRFELSPTVFVAGDGQVSFRVEAGTDWFLTQRLIAEPEFELNASLRAAPDFGINRSGVNDYEMGLRLRYELRRELAPYLGWSRSRRISGSTAPGVDTAPESRLVLGFRVWR